MNRFTKLLITLTIAILFFASVAYSGEACCKGKHGHSHEAPKPKPVKAAPKPKAEPVKETHSHTHEEPKAQNHGHTHSHNEKHGHGHGHSHGGHGHTHDHAFDILGMNCCKMKLWYKAMGSTLLISAAPFFILFFIPLDGGEEHKPFLNVLLAFACGGLLGDAFLHLIPHSIPADSGSHDHAHAHSHGDGDHGHSHNPAYMNCNLWVLAGILTFLVIEKAARVMDI